MPTNTSKVRSIEAGDDTVVDLDMARAQRLEAGDQRVRVRFGGEEFTFPNPREWGIEFLDHLREGDFSSAVQVLLDDTETYERFMSHKPRMGDVEYLLDTMGRRGGVGGLPNSIRSGRS